MKCPMCQHLFLPILNQYDEEMNVVVGTLTKIEAIEGIIARNGRALSVFGCSNCNFVGFFDDLKPTDK